MKKAEFVAKFAEKAGLSKKDADSVCKALLETVVDVVADNDSIQLPGFGTFKAVERAARMVRNPRTGDKMESPATTVMKFTPAAAVKAALAVKVAKKAVKKAAKKK